MARGGQKKRRRLQPQRVPVELAGPSGSESAPSFDNVTSRVERLQPSTGQRYQSNRILVPDVPGLPQEDTDIGLDPDSTKNDQALSQVAIDIGEEAPKPQDKKRKKKQKSLASVSFALKLHIPLLTRF